jgi:hypothetical protein
MYTYTVYTSKLTNVVEGMDVDYKYYDQVANNDKCNGTEATDSGIKSMKNNTASKMKLLADDYQTIDDNSAYPNTTDDNANSYGSDNTTTYDYDSYNNDAEQNEDIYTTQDESCVEYSYEQRTISLQYRNDTKPRIYLSFNKVQIGFAELIQDDNILTINLYKTEKEKIGFIKINRAKTLYEITADLNINKSNYKMKISTNIEEVVAGAEYNLSSIVNIEQYTGNEKTSSILINGNSTLKNSATVDKYVKQSIKTNNFLLYGHIHRLDMIKRNALNVGVDCHYFKPISIDEVLWHRNAILNHYDNEVFLQF